jgi:8-oxo-dGTP pyrophosphatase MutT (NUDIX family)
MPAATLLTDAGMDAIARALAVPAVQEMDEDGLRWAAVALVLRGNTPADADLLFIRRAERVGDPWSGHIAFPGGRRDAGDVSLDATARRETHEELALDLTLANALGVLDDLRPRSPHLPSISVRPFVYAVRDTPALVPNEEVQSAFWVPLITLASPDAIGEFTIERDASRVHFPAYRLGDDVVWGMTERIVTQLLARLRSADAL